MRWADLLHQDQLLQQRELDLEEEKNREDLSRDALDQWTIVPGPEEDRTKDLRTRLSSIRETSGGIVCAPPGAFPKTSSASEKPSEKTSLPETRKKPSGSSSLTLPGVLRKLFWQEREEP